MVCNFDRRGPCVGVEIRDGPILVDRNVFRKFWPSLERLSYAVGFYPNNSGQNSPLNTIGSNSFDNTVTEILATHQFLANVNSCSRSLYAITRPSVCRLSSVTFVRRTQVVQIFDNICTAFGTLAIH